MKFTLTTLVALARLTKRSLCRSCAQFTMTLNGTGFVLGRRSEPEWNPSSFRERLAIDGCALRSRQARHGMHQSGGAGSNVAFFSRSLPHDVRFLFEFVALIKQGGENTPQEPE